ncbi:MAG: glycosyltransferase family 25 protein [Maritimibacter sp.]
MTFDFYKICDALTPFEEQIGVHRIAPVWGAKMSAQDYFDHMKTRVEAARSLLLPGELGCTLAHVEAYKRIEQAAKPALILEDDIHLDAETLSKVKSVIAALNAPDFVSFSEYRHIFQKSEILPNISVAETSDGFWGASAYYISPSMALILHARYNTILDKADNWQEVFMDCSVIPYYSPIFTHDGAASNIHTPGADRSLTSQNPSLFDALRLRFTRFKMVKLAGHRHRRNVNAAKARIAKSGGGTPL